MPTPLRHVTLAFYADGTVIITTSPQPALLVNYLVISHRPRAVAERIEDLYHHVEERSNAVRSGPKAHSDTPTSSALREVSLFGRYCTHLCV